MTAVARKENTALANAFDDVDDLGFGHESASDYLIPRIAVLGDLSPQIKKTRPEYIEGAEPGDIVDTSMGEILAKQGETFEFLPVMRVKEVIEWKPRTSGGGIANRETLSETMESYAERVGATVDKEKYEFHMPNGNELIETHQYYGILLEDMRWAFIPMKKSNLKIAKKFFTRARAEKLPNGNPAPLFYNVYNYGSFLDSGNGNEWYNWTISKVGKTQEKANAGELVASAKLLMEAVRSGEKTGDLNEVDDEKGLDREGAM